MIPVRCAVPWEQGSGTQLAHAVPSMCFPPCCGCGMLKQNMAPFSLDLCSPPMSALVEMQSLLPRGAQGYHSIPVLPQQEDVLLVQCCIFLCFSHPQPLSCVSLPAAVPGRRDVRAVGLNTAGKPAQERGCPAALLPLPQGWGILGSAVPAGAAVIQRLGGGTGLVHGSPPTCSFPWFCCCFSASRSALWTAALFLFAPSFPAG